MAFPFATGHTLGLGEAGQLICPVMRIASRAPGTSTLVRSAVHELIA